MKIALMSFAHVHAAGYARLLSRMPEVELRASDPDHSVRPAGESGGRAFAEDLGIGYLDDYDQLLAWKPDAVIVCSENAKHRADVERAARAGAHVLCEKPIATTLEDAEAMIAACASAGVNLMIAFPVRFSPAFAALRDAVVRGDLGTVRSVSGANNGRVPTDRSWFTDAVLAGGGAITDHTVHLADMIDALFGGPKASTVYAVANDVLHPDREVETAGLVSIRYENGVTAVIDCSWSKPEHYPIWGGLTMQVVGDEGIMDLNPFAQRLDGFSESQRNSLWTDYGPDTDALMLEEFLASVREGRQPVPDGEVGYRTLQIVRAAYDSVRSGTPSAV